MHIAISVVICRHGPADLLDAGPGMTLLSISAGITSASDLQNFRDVSNSMSFRYVVHAPFVFLYIAGIDLCSRVMA
jgi:hypothetical protein